MGKFKQKQAEPMADDRLPTAEEAAVLNMVPEGQMIDSFNECPRCGHMSGVRAVQLGSAMRRMLRGTFRGREYHTIETRRIMCEKCKQIHFVKKYQ